MKVFSNGQWDVNEKRYLFDPNRGAYPGSFVPLGEVKIIEPKDIILIYKT